MGSKTALVTVDFFVRVGETSVSPSAMWSTSSIAIQGLLKVTWRHRSAADAHTT
jgi:hypothetical protein